MTLRKPPKPLSQAVARAIGIPHPRCEKCKCWHDPKVPCVKDAEPMREARERLRSDCG